MRFFCYLCAEYFFLRMEIMKRFLAILLSVLTATTLLSARTYTPSEVPNVQLSDRTRFTSNPDGILSDEAVRAIDMACDSLRGRGLAEVAVVAIDDIATDDVFDFAHTLFSSWGVGGESADNGLGILLVVGRREIRFVTGDGLEGTLTDAVCRRIQQRYMVEYLSRGDYDGGMVAGVAAVARTLSDGGEIFAEEEEFPTEILGVIAMFIAFFVAIIAVVLIYEWHKSKCPKCGKHRLRKQQTAILSSTRKYDFVEQLFVCSACGHNHRRREKIYKDFGDGGGMIIGGGGGSFGGGSSFGGGFGGGHFGGGGAGSRF